MSRFSDLTDDELLALTAREPDAFGEFYSRHVRTVLGYLMGLTRDPERSLDLTAEVFAAALAGARRFKGGGPPASAWLIGIARNKAALGRRREAQAHAARRKLGIPRLQFEDEEIRRVEEILDADREGYLDALVDLPEAERDAVTERVLEERSYSEIAAERDTTEAAIRQRVSRGLARLARRRGLDGGKP